MTVACGGSGLWGAEVVIALVRFCTVQLSDQCSMPGLILTLAGWHFLVLDLTSVSPGVFLAYIYIFTPTPWNVPLPRRRVRAWKIRFNPFFYVLDIL